MIKNFLNVGLGSLQANAACSGAFKEHLSFNIAPEGYIVLFALVALLISLDICLSEVSIVASKFILDGMTLECQVVMSFILDSVSSTWKTLWSFYTISASTPLTGRPTNDSSALCGAMCETFQPRMVATGQLRLGRACHRYFRPEIPYFLVSGANRTPRFETKLSMFWYVFTFMAYSLRSWYVAREHILSSSFISPGCCCTDCLNSSDRFWAGCRTIFLTKIYFQNTNGLHTTTALCRMTSIINYSSNHQKIDQVLVFSLK